MSNLPPDEARRLYEAIRKNVEKRYEVRTAFFGNLASFLLLNFLFWFLWVGPDATLRLSAFQVHWLAAFISAGWAIGLAVQFINWIFTEMRENAIRRELERFGIPLALPYDEIAAEKDKRLVRLTEDGELEEVDEALSKKAQRRASPDLPS